MIANKAVHGEKRKSSPITNRFLQPEIFVPILLFFGYQLLKNVKLNRFYLCLFILWLICGGCINGFDVCLFTLTSMEMCANEFDEKEFLTVWFCFLLVLVLLIVAWRHAKY